jgi:hypothetical protein
VSACTQFSPGGRGAVFGGGKCPAALSICQLPVTAFGRSFCLVGFFDTAVPYGASLQATLRIRGNVNVRSGRLGVCGPGRPKAEIRAAVRYLLRGATGGARGDIVQEIIAIVRQVASGLPPEPPNLWMMVCLAARWLPQT